MLVEIDSAEENSAIISEINTRGFNQQEKQFWLGLTDRLTEGEWVLESTRKEPTFTNWDIFQPDNGGIFKKKNEKTRQQKLFKNEHCAYITTSTKWNDFNCKETGFLHWTLNALCEKSKKLVEWSG